MAQDDKKQRVEEFIYGVRLKTQGLTQEQLKFVNEQLELVKTKLEIHLKDTALVANYDKVHPSTIKDK